MRKGLQPGSQVSGPPGPMSRYCGTTESAINGVTRGQAHDWLRGCGSGYPLVRLSHTQCSHRNSDPVRKYRYQSVRTRAGYERVGDSPRQDRHKGKHAAGICRALSYTNVSAYYPGNNNTL